MPEVIAEHWRELEGSVVECLLCPRNCKIPPGGSGFCLVRKNKNGKLVSTVFSEVSSAGYDPVEKKPLYHFYPGSVIFSVGTNGCNLDCKSCQNWEISRRETRRYYLSPEELVELAGKHNSIGVAFTYNEPVIWFEYIKASAKLLKEKGFKVVLVSNGNINLTALAEIIEFVDAFNIDLKGMTKDYYRKFSSLDNPNVWEVCEFVKKKGKWLELTKLVVPGFDEYSEEYFEKFAKWISENLGKEVPIHFSRFFPAYKLTYLQPTPIEALFTAYRVAKEYLYYPYTGNIADEETSTTYCPKCGFPLVKRFGYSVHVVFDLKEKSCPRCKRPVDFVID